MDDLCARLIEVHDDTWPIGIAHNEPINRDGAEAAKRIAELEADLADTLKAILLHFGPDGAKKVTDMVIEQRTKRA